MWRAVAACAGSASGWRALALPSCYLHLCAKKCMASLPGEGGDVNTQISRQMLWDQRSIIKRAVASCSTELLSAHQGQYSVLSSGFTVADACWKLCIRQALVYKLMICELPFLGDTSNPLSKGRVLLATVFFCMAEIGRHFASAFTAHTRHNHVSRVRFLTSPPDNHPRRCSADVFCRVSKLAQIQEAGPVSA